MRLHTSLFLYDVFHVLNQMIYVCKTVHEVRGDDSARS